MRTLPVASAESDDAREWLAGLADHTMPRDDEATGLIVFARSVEPSVQSMLFDDGVLGMLLGASTGDWLAAEGLLSVYLNLRDDCDSMGLMPEPAAALGIRVARDDFERWHEDEWVVDEVAWRAEVHRRCTASVAGMLALWRSRFFEALLESKRHTT